MSQAMLVHSGFERILESLLRHKAPRIQHVAVRGIITVRGFITVRGIMGEVGERAANRHKLRCISFYKVYWRGAGQWNRQWRRDDRQRGTHCSHWTGTDK